MHEHWAHRNGMLPSSLLSRISIGFSIMMSIRCMYIILVVWLCTIYKIKSSSPFSIRSETIYSMFPLQTNRYRGVLVFLLSFHFLCVVLRNKALCKCKQQPHSYTYWFDLSANVFATNLQTLEKGRQKFKWKRKGRKKKKKRT